VRVNLQEALVCLVESTECAHGADREGSALWRARDVGLRFAGRLEEKEERRRKARARRVERLEAARRAVRDPVWDAWERELMARHAVDLTVKWREGEVYDAGGKRLNRLAFEKRPEEAFS
jgi:hypothetical protein